jgi:hypothetical protein
MTDTPNKPVYPALERDVIETMTKCSYKYAVVNPFTGCTAYGNDTADIHSMLILWAAKKEFNTYHKNINSFLDDDKYMEQLRDLGYKTYVR